MPRSPGPASPDRPTPTPADGRESTTAALAQVVGVALVVAVAIPVAFSLAVGLLMSGLFLGLPVLLAGLVAVLALVGSRTSRGSRLTGSRGGRVAWALTILVLGGGASGWLYVRLRGLGVDPTASVPVGVALAAVVFALCTAVLTFRRRLALPALAVLVATAVTVGAVGVVRAPARELEQRLAFARATREEVVVTNVPGYELVDPALRSHGTDGVVVTYAEAGMQEDDGATWRSEWREFTLSATEADLYRCVARPADGPASPGDVSCESDAPGQWYSSWFGVHEYAARHGDLVVVAQGGHDVAREDLARAAVEARQARDDELLDVVPPVPGHLRRW